MLFREVLFQVFIIVFIASIFLLFFALSAEFYDTDLNVIIAIIIHLHLTAFDTSHRAIIGTLFPVGGAEPVVRKLIQISGGLPTSVYFVLIL